MTCSWCGVDGATRSRCPEPFLCIRICGTGRHKEVTRLRSGCPRASVACQWCCAPRRWASRACATLSGVESYPEHVTCRWSAKPFPALLLKWSLWIIYPLLVSWINYTYKWRQKNYNKCCFWLWHIGMRDSSQRSRRLLCLAVCDREQVIHSCSYCFCTTNIQYSFTSVTTWNLSIRFDMSKQTLI